ncbi:hypothetical protein ABCR94_11260 [Streptomyces sp. 21So2-11]|uniref:hypothetical protein n=1 Tax=Streptomyces sp. 21So2-11 TaxID=3144408 RepID=UPI00321A5637
MADRERKQHRGTPSTHLAGQVDLVAQFTDQARVGLERESDTVRLFMAVYSGFLIEAGSGIRCLLDPSVIEQATVAIRRLAPDAPHPQRNRATRLLATLWSAGIVASIDTEHWISEAPELPEICLRMAMLFPDDPD